jgi:D-glycero-beta-D-manno-heptose 1-phosphate adenylyltransferase
MTSWKEYAQNKIISPNDLSSKVAELRQRGLRIATLNGSFDLLHAGHMYMIYEAAKVADLLIVALNSDTSIQAYKSPKRPIIPLDLRLEMLAAIRFVDYLTWFEETDPRALLEKIKPDIHVNGIEYREGCIEEETVKKNGGRLHFVDRIAGLATSEIIKKIELAKG